VSFTAFFFETTPLLGMEGLHLPFECVLIDAGDTFSRRGVSSQLFDEHLYSGRGTTIVKSFFNLGKDALLVVPCHAKGARASAYGTLATFLREAPGEQVRELWRVVAERVLKVLDECPGMHLWVNTDGRAVPWLHLRIDTAPKYIKHQPYHHPYGQPTEGSSQLANSSKNNSVIDEQRSPATMNAPTIVPSDNNVYGQVNHEHGKPNYEQGNTYGEYSRAQMQHAAERSRSQVNDDHHAKLPQQHSGQYPIQRRHSNDDLNKSSKHRSAGCHPLPAECDATNGRHPERSEGSGSRNNNTLVAREDELDCGNNRQASHCGATKAKSTFFF
jgi:hypothetical protein